MYHLFMIVVIFPDGGIILTCGNLIYLSRT